MIEVAIIVAVIVGVVQVVKMAGLPSRFAALFSIALGLVAAFLVAPEATTGLTAFNGVLYGLMASGLYSGVRSTTGV